MAVEEQEKMYNVHQNDIVWFASCALITTVATFLRFFWLGLKPFHHDEGVNGWFLTNLFRDGVYKYDPANYHGPTLYYITLGFVEVFGLDTIPVRWSVAVWGVLIIVLAFYLKRYIGRNGSLFAALFLALSPGMVFISRYFIHEIFFVFLGLGFVLAVLFFIEKEKAGPGAIAWMALILFVCFLPSALNVSSAFTSDPTTLWILRCGFIIVEGFLIFFVIRMLKAWNEGRPIYLLLAAACVGLMFATKETSFITLLTMAIACVCVWAREQIAKAASEKRFPTTILALALAASIVLVGAISYKLPDVPTDFGKRVHDLTSGPTAESFSNLFYAVILIVPALLAYLLYRWDLSRSGSAGLNSAFFQPSLSAFRDALGTQTDRILIVAASVALIVYIVVLFFSSFFTYPEGIRGFFEAYTIWLKTGSKDHTQNGIWAYIDWGMKSDGPIMVLSLVGLIIALVKGRDRFAMFAGLWAFGLFLAYTIIPYKTPWLALSFSLPMCIAAGYALNEFFESKINSVKGIGFIAAGIATVILAYQTYDLNFVRYDDEDTPMVYAHTQREFLDMIRDIEHFAELSGKGKDTSIDIVSPDYWPMVWYMREYPRAIFHGRFADSTAEMIIAKKGDQDNDVMRKYSANYEYYASYKLRSGVDLVLLVRKDLAGEKGSELYNIRK